MYRVLSASKDAYITNKIIGNTFRATDANTGKAGTLDLFKLYDESTLSGSDSPVEISRILIHFDLNPLREMTGSTLDIGHSSFNCVLKLHDIYGGQTTPSNFKLIAFPLSRSFDEGVGRDVIRFSDLDACNFITASVSSGTPTLWHHTGANKQGFLGSSDIDIISSGTLSGSSTNVDLFSEQTFSRGDEDLSLDVTTVVSGVIAGMIPDYGFRISFSGTNETDQKTRFVKRFASRNATNTSVRPKLIVKYNDSTTDHHNDFFFNLTGSVFINNYHRGIPSNILSGAAASEVSGDDCIILRLVSGSFSRVITGSQHKIGLKYVTGVYSASFSISEFESTLRNEIVAAKSATFNAFWGSTDESIGYHTGSLVIKNVERSSFENASRRILVHILNMKSEYLRTEKVRFRVFAEDIDQKIIALKTPIEKVSETFSKMHFRVRDFESNNIVIPFNKSDSSTRLSCDSKGMYFDFFMDTLPKGRLYVFDFLIGDRGSDLIFTDVAAKFRVT